jgi:hypothetical protein
VDANRAAAVVFVALASVLGLILWRLQGPAPLPADAPAAQFSAARAIDAWRAIAPDDRSHALGTAAHDDVLNRILARLQALGYKPSVQRSFACSPNAVCAPVANIIAELPGDARAQTLLVTSHYDSVPAGPGASDDGIGVAALLETARAIRTERFRNTVRFLITDGEEAGLLGAQAFVADPERMRGVSAVINVEDRGTSGPSLLFETSRHNRWLIAVVARALPRPWTNSLLYEAYELLPNDTDLTVFKNAGLAGVNFAAVGRVAHYHTPLDNLANITPSLVQDHGAHLLGLTRGLANSDLQQSTDDNAIYFDVLALKMIWWPQQWTMLICGITLAVLLIAAAIRMRNGETSAGSITLGILSFFLSIALAAIGGVIASWIVSLRQPAAVWAAQPGPSIAAAWLIGIGIAVGVAAIFHARAGFDGLFIGHAICWTALAIALAQFLPGASYIAIVPAVAFAVSVALSALVAADSAIGSIICAVAAAVLHFPLALLFYDAFGRPAIAVIAVVLALVATTFSPIAASANAVRRPALAAVLGMVIVCLAMQLAIPAFTPSSPRRLNVRYVDDGVSRQWEVDAITPALRMADRFRSARVTLPWARTSSMIHSAPARKLALQPPELRILTREPRRIVLKIVSPRGGQRMSLTFRSAGGANVRINGVTPPSAGLRGRSSIAEGWRRVAIRGASEAEIEITLQKEGPVEAIVADYTFGLPPEGAALVTARNRSTAVPSDDGDGVLMMRRTRI